MKTTMTLADIGVGQTATVLGYAGGGQSCRQKLLAMGLLKGTTFAVLRVAPMGDPIEIRVRDFHLSLRKAEAQTVLVAGGVQ